VVFQNHSLLPWLTCFENVYLAVERVFGAGIESAAARAHGRSAGAGGLSAAAAASGRTKSRAA
jgi:nitrate/nitrite transport system ATP-binding protein